MSQNEEFLRELIRKYIGWEEHYKEFRLLESDLRFFRMYMKRETKSSFDFDVKITRGMSNKTFEDLWKRSGRYADENTLETVFAQFNILKLIIKDLIREERTVTDEDIKKFVLYLERYDDFTVSNYVSDFIGCSHTSHFIQKKLDNIMGKEA